MFIKSWTAYVAVPEPKIMHSNTYLPKPTEPSYYLRLAKLYLVVDFVCPGAGCKTKTRVEWIYPMDYKLLGEETQERDSEPDLTLRLRAAAEILGADRDCDKCGIRSNVPAQHLEQWLAEVLAEVDIVWLNDCHEALEAWRSPDGRKPPERADPRKIMLRLKDIKFDPV